MKKLISFSCILFVSASLLAQAGKIVAKPKPVIKKTTPQPIVLKTLMDSASYSIGLSIASFCKQQGITKPNTGLCAKSINDVMDNKSTLITDAVSNEIINKLLTEGKSAPKPATKPVISKSLLKTANDSASYAIGLNHASFFKQQGITNLNTALINKAINDVQLISDNTQWNKMIKDIGLYMLDNVTEIGLPTPYVTVDYWPWVKNYYNEFDAGQYDAKDIWAEIYINQSLKKQLGH